MPAELGAPSFLNNLRDTQAAQSASPALTNPLAKKMSAQKADGIAHEFEAMFMSQMLSPMWEGIETDGPFGGGSAEETFRGMLVNEYGSLITKAGGLGIADSVKAELIKSQEIPNATAKL